MKTASENLITSKNRTSLVAGLRGPLIKIEVVLQAVLFSDRQQKSNFLWRLLSSFNSKKVHREHRPKKKINCVIKNPTAHHPPLTASLSSPLPSRLPLLSSHTRPPLAPLLFAARPWRRTELQDCNGTGDGGVEARGRRQGTRKADLAMGRSTGEACGARPQREQRRSSWCGDSVHGRRICRPRESWLAGEGKGTDTTVGGEGEGRSRCKRWIWWQGVAWWAELWPGGVWAADPAA